MIVNKKILDKKQYVIPYDEQYLYKLDVIQNYFKHVRDIPNNINCYPYHDDNYYNLLYKIASYVNVDVDNIILTNGSDNALKILLDAFSTESSNILIPIPTYPHFISFAELSNGTIYKININDSSELININYEQYHLVYIVSPNLPLGYVLSKHIIRNLLIKFPNTVFIMDEAYVEYGGESCAELIYQHNNIFITRTFSKAFGLAGARLGYIICRDKNFLLPLVNDKNVTESSINLANIVMNNLKHYMDNVQDVENIKEYLKIELSCICFNDSEIYDYNIKAGNFFIIYCRNVIKVVEIFKNHGILVRNKHDDVQNAIRICLGPLYMMDDVLSVCKLINIKHILYNSNIIIDLDGTLRKGAKNDSNIYNYTDVLLKNTNHLILTNNNITPKEVVSYFKTKNITISKVYTSLSLAKQYLKKNNYKAYVYGNQDYFKKYLETIEKCDCILLATINIGFKDIVHICEHLQQKKLLYTDDSFSCSISDCSEIEYYNSTIIPDIGSLIEMIKKCGYNVELIGKPNCKINGYTYMIGDSLTDIKFAKNNNLIPIIVSNTTYYDIKDMIFYINFANVLSSSIN